MLSKSVSWLVIFFLHLACISSIAQTQTMPNPHGYWLAYSGDNKLNSRFGLHTEMQWRNMYLDHSVQSILTRVGVNMYIHPQVMATAGYGYIYVEPTSKNVIGSKVLENRVWQQLVLRNKKRNFSLEHRYRLEQRYLHNTTKDTRLKSHRLRYRFQSLIPLHPITPHLSQYFVAFNNEIFVNFKNEPTNIFDRNRFFIGLGYQVSPNMNLQLGYMNQFVNFTGNPKAQVDQLALLAFTYNTNWFRNYSGE